MNKKTGIFALIAGGLIGAVVALLYAPRSGEETRQLLVEDSREIKDKAIRSIQDVQDSALITIEESRARLEALTQETRKRFSERKDSDQIPLDEQKQRLEEQPS